MNKLIKAYIDICLLRRAPQDIPASATLRNFTAAAYFVLGIILSMMATQPLEAAILTSAVDTLMLGLLAFAPLAAMNMKERFTQTFTALTGSGIVLSIISLPIVILFFDKEPTAIASLIIISVWFWTLMVLGHILRHALNLPLMAGIAIAVTYIMFSTALIGIISGSNG